MICSPISLRSDGSTSPSMAIRSGRQSPSKIASGPSEIRAQHSSTRLSVLFREDSAMSRRSRFKKLSGQQFSSALVGS
jgi:hypothetical protein